MTDVPNTLTHRSRRGDQTYFLTAVVTGTRQDGAVTRWAVWWTACRDCHAPFYVTSGVSKAALAKGPGTVRCIAHRKVTSAAVAEQEAPLIAQFGAPGRTS